MIPKREEARRAHIFGEMETAAATKAAPVKKMKNGCAGIHEGINATMKGYMNCCAPRITGGMAKSKRPRGTSSCSRRDSLPDAVLRRESFQLEQKRPLRVPEAQALPYPL